MREFSLSLDKTLRAGLRTDTSVRNSGLLAECTNLRADPLAVLSGLHYGTMPDTFPPISWPFPHLLQSSRHLFLCDLDAIYTVSDSMDLEQVTTYNGADHTSTRLIPAGGRWHLADFQTTYALFNGECVAYRTNEDGVAGNTNKTYVQTSLPMTTGCNFRGQLVCGGCDPSKMWPASWQSMVNVMATRIDTGLTLDWTAQNNFVFWSMIGGGDLLWLLDPTVAIASDISSAGYTDSKPFWFDMFQRGDAGFMPLPTRGGILCVKPLGNAVVVYTTSGVFALLPAMLDESIPTFGLRVLAHSLSVANRGAVAGDETKHWFITTEGRLYTITADLSIQQLPYQRYIQPMGSDVCLSHNPLSDELYISNDTLSYILTTAGLTSTSFPIASAEAVNGALLTVQSAEADADYNFSVVTDDIDFGYRAFKFIQSVEVAAYDVTDLQVSVYWSSSNTTAKSQTGWIRCTPEGIATPMISGLDFQIAIKGTAGEDARIDSITINWKATDKRFIRGLRPGPAQA